MTKALVFDCWGTLFYTDLKPHPAAVFAEKIGKNIHDYAFVKTFEKHFMLEKHYTYETPVRDLLKELNIPLLDSRVKKLAEDLEKVLDFTKAYPDTLESLKKLGKDYKLGMITNTDYLSFKKLDELFGVDKIFDTITKSYEIGILKPTPGIFEATLSKLHVNKNEAIMVGDSLKDDVEAAKIAGIRGVLIDRKNKYPNYSNKIMSLNELQKYLSEG
jgi:2-haloalkanoic acid dehalogenase type II